jgi:hypothetical protein
MVMREELSKHKTYEEAKTAYSKHEVQDNLQIRRISSGFKVVRRTPSANKEVQGPGRRRKPLHRSRATTLNNE